MTLKEAPGPVTIGVTLTPCQEQCCVRLEITKISNPRPLNAAGLCNTLFQLASNIKDLCNITDPMDVVAKKLGISMEQAKHADAFKCKRTGTTH